MNTAHHEVLGLDWHSPILTTVAFKYPNIFRRLIRLSAPAEGSVWISSTGWRSWQYTRRASEDDDNENKTGGRWNHPGSHRLRNAHTRNTDNSISGKSPHACQSVGRSAENNTHTSGEQGCWVWWPDKEEEVFPRRNSCTAGNGSATPPAAKPMPPLAAEAARSTAG